MDIKKLRNSGNTEKDIEYLKGMYSSIKANMIGHRQNKHKGSLSYKEYSRDKQNMSRIAAVIEENMRKSMKDKIDRGELKMKKSFKKLLPFGRTRAERKVCPPHYIQNVRNYRSGKSRGFAYPVFAFVEKDISSVVELEQKLEALRQSSS